MFRRFQMLKKGIETIKKVAPSVGNKLGKKKVELLKKMGKTQRTNPENFKKAGGDKLKKEILGARTQKAFGGRIKKKKPETKEQKSIKEKILPKKKKDRLEELRKDLGLKKGGSALKPVDKQKNPGLAKLPTQVRNKMGYMKKGGSVRKFGGGKK